MPRGECPAARKRHRSESDAPLPRHDRAGMGGEPSSCLPRAAGAFLCSSAPILTTGPRERQDRPHSRIVEALQEHREAELASAVSRRDAADLFLARHHEVEAASHGLELPVDLAASARISFTPGCEQPTTTATPFGVRIAKLDLVHPLTTSPLGRSRSTASSAHARRPRCARLRTRRDARRCAWTRGRCAAWPRTRRKRRRRRTSASALP